MKKTFNNTYIEQLPPFANGTYVLQSSLNETNEGQLDTFYLTDFGFHPDKVITEIENAGITEFICGYNGSALFRILADLDQRGWKIVKPVVIEKTYAELYPEKVEKYRKENGETETLKFWSKHVEFCASGLLLRKEE